MTTPVKFAAHTNRDLFRERTLPGPASSKLLIMQDQQESNARTYPRHLPFGIASASGSLVTDVDGNQYVDLLSGAGVLALGHGHPELVAAARHQLGVLTHGLDMPTPSKAEFTGKLLSRIPGYSSDIANWKLHFCGPTGANAVDAAVKLARIVTGRHNIVSFQGGFHGTTHLGMGLTGLLSQRAGIAGIGDGVTFLPYSDDRNYPGQGEDGVARHIALIETMLADPNGGIAPPAAIIVEIVQGEGGVVIGEPAFITALADIAKRIGALLIVDEIQTGCGRTGRFFAYEHHGITPDIICLSKALSGLGTPAALIAYRTEHDHWQPGTHTGTFRGNQLAFASGNVFLDIIDRDEILTHVQSIEQVISQTLAPLQQFRRVHEVRGVGAMWGVELVDTTGLRNSGGALALAVQKACVERGIITEVGGRNDSVLRLLPPLNIELDLLSEACTIIAQAIERLTA
ncbi:aspartate aminotransferase family protein [Rhodococcus qingshengii]|uniref:aspartate aminotransferase family protein n=1 Tax=Rhodococcus qingshengii TaxID=334542 RepID=UPI00364D5DB4